MNVYRRTTSHARFLRSLRNRIRHPRPGKFEFRRLYRLSERFFAWLLSLYEGSLTWVLRHPAPRLLVLLITIGVNAYLLVIVPKGFFPQQDTGRLAGGIQGAQDSSFAAMRQRMARFVDIVKSDPGVANVVAFTDSGGGPRRTRAGCSFP